MFMFCPDDMSKTRVRTLVRVRQCLISPQFTKSCARWSNQITADNIPVIFQLKSANFEWILGELVKNNTNKNEWLPIITQIKGILSLKNIEIIDPSW